eukprot:g11661.t1
MAPPTSANELMDQMALEAARTTTTTTPPPYLIKLRLEVQLSLPEQVQLSQATSVWSDDPGFVDSWQQGLCWTIKADIRARFLRCLNVQLLRIAESVGFEGRRTLRVLADVVGGMLVPRQPELTLSAAALAPSSKNPSSEDATDSEQERSLQALGATTTAPGRKMASVFLEYQVGIQSPAEANSVFVAAKEMPKDTLSGNLNLFVMRAQAADDLSASTRFILPIVSTVTEVVQGNSTSGGRIERIEGQEVPATNAAGGTGRGGCVAAGLTMIVLLSGVWGLPW